MARRIHFSGWVIVEGDHAEHPNNTVDMIFEHGFDFVEAIDWDYQPDEVWEVDDEEIDD